VNFRNFRKSFPEFPKISRTHGQGENASKNWLWAHTSLLICICIIPLNSTTFLRRKESKIYNIPFAHAVNSLWCHIQRGMHRITTHRGRNILHICFHENC
jgi:hypothetical protein